MTLTENQLKKIYQLYAFVQEARANGKPDDWFNKDKPESQHKDTFKEFCTNILAWLILIEDNE